MKRLFAFLIVLVVALSACLPVSANDECDHENCMSSVENSESSYTYDDGCHEYRYYTHKEKCPVCGYTETVVHDIELIYTEHTDEELVTEWCDGYMHHQYYACACGENNHTVSDWCSNPDSCPARGRRR